MNMGARVFAPSSVFVSAVSPVILEASPGNFQSMLSAVQPLTVTKLLDISPLGLLKQMGVARNLTSPWRATALTAAKPMPAFNMYAGLFDGWTLASIAEHPSVAAIYEDRPIKLLQFPYAPAEGTFSVKVESGPLYFTSTQWTRRLMGADVANSKGYSGQGVNACVVDTGGTRGNPQTMRMVRQTVIPGNHFDVISHGEWCASALGGTLFKDSTFSAETRMPVYCEGMAPKCNLYQVKALDFIIGTAMTSQLIAGLEAALNLRADVLSCSWGAPVSTSEPTGDPFYSVMQKLDQSGMLLAVAAGNSGPQGGTIDTPGALPNVITVGSYNAVGNVSNSMFGAAGEVSGFSSRGPAYVTEVKPDTIAPGAIIDSGVSPFSEMALSYTHRPHGASAIAGTSMATPQVAGLLACMRQAHKQLLNRVLTNAEVKTMLASLGQPKNNDSGWGPLTWAMYEEWMATQYNMEV
jgi:subtilisin family serine protease